MADNEDRFAQSRNFLATDEVPETIFGIPVVAREEDYTPEDLAFFRKHPEAGGYYDLGDGEEQPPEEKPVQGAIGAGATDRRFKGWGKYPSVKEAEAAEADAVAFVNERLYGKDDMPPLSKADLADSEESYRWLASNPLNESTVIERATLPHTGRPRVASRNMFRVDDRGPYQGDRFSSTYIVDESAYRKDPEGYKKTGAWVVAPTVYADKDGVSRLHTGADAYRHYKETNEHFGVYRGLEAAEFGALWDHHRGNAEWYEKSKKETRQAAKGGEARAAYPGSLNNPGNVEKRAERRQGETDSPHERWAMFSTPQDGLYAMADSIRQIADVKLAGKPFTIRSLSEIYAPRKNKAGAKENDTAKYIRNISRYSGIDADAELDRWNPGDMSRLLKTMVRFESGKPHSDWFTDDEYGRAAEILQEGAAD